MHIVNINSIFHPVSRVDIIQSPMTIQIKLMNYIISYISLLGLGITFGVTVTAVEKGLDDNDLQSTVDRMKK
ncbi:MAG: hypothetical protein ACRDA4_10080 [Filifactoraceae bacterium]